MHAAMAWAASRVWQREQTQGGALDAHDSAQAEQEATTAFKMWQGAEQATDAQNRAQQPSQQDTVQQPSQQGTAQQPSQQDTAQQPSQQDAVQQSAQDVAQDAAQEAAQDIDAAQDATRKAAQDAAQDVAQDAAQEAAHDTAHWQGAALAEREVFHAWTHTALARPRDCCKLYCRASAPC